MSLPTVAVTFTAYDQGGGAIEGARVLAKLDQTEIYQGFVVPEQVEASTDAAGIAVLNLWPNALGAASSKYRVRAWHPDTGAKFLDATVSVPDSACALEQILVQEPYPPIDAAEQALIAAQGALADVTAQALIASTSATAAEGSATSAASSATAAASSATTAGQHAASASTSMDAAAASETSASLSASAAAVSASTANTRSQDAAQQAGIATTKAAEAAADRTQTGLDRQATAADRTQTGLDARSADASAVAAGVSATEAVGQVVLAAQKVVLAKDQADLAAASAQAAAAAQNGAEAALLTITNVGEVAANLGAINTAANNMAAIVAAPTQAASAAASATQANTSRLGAEQARNDAVAVVTGGTSSLTAQAGKLPIADAQARLDASWANALGVAPLLLPQAFLSASRTVARGNIVLTPGTASVPSGVTVSVDEQAQWVITGDGYSVLQYQAEFGAWGTVRGTKSDLVGVSDVQTLSNKTLTQPAIQQPVINGGQINNASFLIPAAVSHTNLITTEVEIPAGSNALSVAPIQILSGGVVKVGAGSNWSFLWQ